MLAPKLLKGDEIRIIATSLFFDKENDYEKIARINFELLDYKVSFFHNFENQKEGDVFFATFGDFSFQSKT